MLLFGPGYGFMYNYVGIVIGSMLAFLIARQLGKPFIRKIMPVKIFQKYIIWLDKGSWFDKLFALGIFLPGAPDDFLCMLAGVTVTVHINRIRTKIEKDSSNPQYIDTVWGDGYRFNKN